MKLGDVIRLLDTLDFVIIWGKDDEDPLYEGDVLNIPWSLLDYEFYKDRDRDIFPLSTRMDNGKSILVINLKEE